MIHLNKLATWLEIVTRYATGCLLFFQ